MEKNNNDKNLRMHMFTWDLLNKYQVLDYDLSKGAYHDRMFDKSKQYIEYRNEIIRRFDEKTNEISYLISKGKDTKRAFESSYKLLKVLHGVDVPDKIYKLFTLCKQNIMLGVKNQVINVLNLIECSTKNLCLINEIRDEDIAKNAEMIQFVLEGADKFHTILRQNDIKIDGVYKNITFVNNLAEAGNDEEQKQTVVSKHKEYIKWENCHEPYDNRLNRYPQKEFSPKVLQFMDTFKDREGM